MKTKRAGIIAVAWLFLGARGGLPAAELAATPTASPAPEAAADLKILAASYSFGGQFADVTARVRELIVKNARPVSERTSAADPEPGEEHRVGPDEEFAAAPDAFPKIGLPVHADGSPVPQIIHLSRAGRRSALRTG